MPEAAAAALREAHGAALGALRTAEGHAARQARDEGERARAVHARATAVARNRAAQAVAEHTLAARDAAPADAPDADPLAVADRVVLGTLQADGAPSGVNTPVSVPFVVPLVGRGHLLVHAADGAALTRAAVRGALRGTGAAQLDVVGYDPRLSGALAPFAPLGAAVEDHVVVHTRASDLERVVQRLADEVQEVHALLRGTSHSLADLRAQTGHPVGRYRLVVLLDYPTGVEEETHRRILALAAAGPAAGISFVVQSDPAQPAPAWWRPDEIAAHGTAVVDGRDGRPVRADHPELVVHPAELPGDVLAAEVDALVERARRAAVPHVGFADVQPTGSPWAASSRDGLTFAIGRSGRDVTEITLGDAHEQRHNVLITGAVGQGKSNLLKVLVHSLAQRYSPDELEMYLLDFKEGVTLYPFAPTPESPDYLPHARVLGLESDRDLGLAVLRHVEAEFARRARLLRPYGDDVASYRRALPAARMPRIVLVIDEFHLLFDPVDAVAEAAAQLLETLARKGRSYGVHLVLASQTISGIAALLTRENGIFAQFPVRLALKNTVAESYATLSQGNDAAARLRARGEAVLNLDYGRPEANRRTVVAAADDATLAALRTAWWTAARAEGRPPLVFDSGRPLRAGSVLPALAGLRRRVRDHGAAPAAVVGVPVAVDAEPLAVALPADPGRNIAVLGAAEKAGGTGDEPTHHGVGILQTAAVSLALQHPAGDAEFVALDSLDDGTAERTGQPAWLGLMARLGFPVRHVPRAGIPAYLQDLVAEDLPARAPGGPRRYLLGFGLDRADLDRPDAFAHRGAEDLQTLLRDGSRVGVHLLAWWASTAAFRAQIGFDGGGYLETLVLLRLDQSAAQELLGPFVTWSVRDNRALVSDRTQLPEPTAVVPFAPVLAGDARALLAADWEV